MTTKEYFTLDMQAHSVANIGNRPCGVSLARLRELIRKIYSEEYTALVIKPGFFPEDSNGRRIQKQVEALIVASGLDVLATKKVILERERIKDLYSDLFDPQIVPVSSALTQIRVNLEEYMSSDSVFCYVVNGESAVDKAKTIKSAVRRSYGFIKGSQEIKNVIHTPDKNDVDNCLDILFGK